MLCFLPEIISVYLYTKRLGEKKNHTKSCKSFAAILDKSQFYVDTQVYHANWF